MKESDISHPASMAGKLSGKIPGFKNDPLSAYLFQHFSRSSRQLLRKTTGRGEESCKIRKRVISTEINRIIQEEYLYSEERFARITADSLLKRPGIDINRKTVTLQLEEPEGEDLVMANRLLLQLAYRKDLKPFGGQFDRKESYTSYSFWLLLIFAFIFVLRKSAPWLFSFLLFFLLSLGPYLKIPGIPLDSVPSLPYKYA